MTPVPIKERETDKYALKQPDMLRVSIKDGILVDNREKHYGITLNELRRQSQSQAIIGRRSPWDQ